MDLVVDRRDGCRRLLPRPRNPRPRLLPRVLPPLSRLRDAFDELGDAPHRREFGRRPRRCPRCSHRRRQLHRGDAVHADVRQRVVRADRPARHLRRRGEDDVRNFSRRRARTPIVPPRRRPFGAATSVVRHSPSRIGVLDVGGVYVFRPRRRPERAARGDAVGEREHARASALRRRRRRESRISNRLGRVDRSTRRVERVDGDEMFRSVERRGVEATRVAASRARSRDASSRSASFSARARRRARGANCAAKSEYERVCAISSHERRLNGRRLNGRRLVGPVGARTRIDPPRRRRRSRRLSRRRSRRRAYAA